MRFRPRLTAQSVGLGRISNTTSELDEMTQQNAALVEESTAAAELLREQAHRLATVVARFKSHSGDSGDIESVSLLQINAPQFESLHTHLLAQ